MYEVILKISIIGAPKGPQVGHLQMFFLTSKKWSVVKVDNQLGEEKMALSV